MEYTITMLTYRECERLLSDLLKLDYVRNSNARGCERLLINLPKLDEVSKSIIPHQQ